MTRPTKPSAERAPAPTPESQPPGSPEGASVVVPEGLVSIGVFVRAHGLRGEMRVKVWNDDSDLLAEIEEVSLLSKDGSVRRARLERPRAAGDHWLAGVVGVQDRDAAEAMRGTEILVSREDFPELDEDEVYLVDLLGFEVRDGDQVLGVVEGFFEYPSVDCLKVVGDDGIRELPMLDEFVEGLDREAKVILATRSAELPVEAKRPAR